MNLRATATFPDGVPPAVQEWDDTLTDVDTASRWLDAMARLTPGTTTELVQLCDDHGDEDVTACDDCAEPMCAVEAARSLSGWDAYLCERCREMRSEESEAEYDPRPPVAAERPEVLR